MAITIGLDFGTHQTKVCVENSDDPLHKHYEFFQWSPGVFTIPSVIQIKEDGTINYGIIDMENCLKAKKFKPLSIPLKTYPLKPQEPQKPRMRIKPNEPIATIEDENGNKLEVPYSQLFGTERIYVPKSKFKEYQDWYKRCATIENAYCNMHSAWETLSLIYPDYQYPEPPEPIYPEEPYLECYHYDYDPIFEASQKQIIEYKQWKNKCNQIDQTYNIKKIEFERNLEEYDALLSEWKSECEKIDILNDNINETNEQSLKDYPMVFRYFKQATFASYKWDYEIEARKLTVLFLAYVIFRLEAIYGTNFSIQMGVPASESNFSYLKEYATGCLIQAFRLVENVYQNDFEKFMAASYIELLDNIPQYEFTQDLKDEYGILILPEAYAALRSLTSNSKIPPGMSILLDMGGGTTDISFFVLETTGEPHIYHFESINKGLNYFLEYENIHKLGINDFSSKKELCDVPISIFNEALNNFQTNIYSSVKRLTNFLHSDTIKRGFNKHAFTDVLKNRPVVFTGGGCYDSRLRFEIDAFTDIMYINKEIIKIHNLKDASKIDIPYSILATAYGLSIACIDDDIYISKKEDLFAEYSNMKSSSRDEHREHGMYED